MPKISFTWQLILNTCFYHFVDSKLAQRWSRWFWIHQLKQWALSGHESLKIQWATKLFVVRLILNRGNKVHSETYSSESIASASFESSICRLEMNELISLTHIKWNISCAIVRNCVSYKYVYMVLVDSTCLLYSVQYMRFEWIVPCSRMMGFHKKKH